VSSASKPSSELDETHALQRPPIVLTTTDRDCLFALIRDTAAIADTENIRFLREELARADIAPDDVAPKLVVKMGSRVKFVDHADERMHRATLVYPDEAGGDGCVSILTSVGTALIGLGPGQSIRWTEQGAERSLAVLEVAAGDTKSPCLQGGH
jgi:regulator of nucleoside diphosphate kinase